MFALLIALYAVHVISVPAGMVVDLSPTSDYSTIGLSSVSLSRSGALAVVMYPQASYPQKSTELLVVRSDGSQVILNRPPDSTLAKYFVQYALVDGQRAYPGTRFAGVRLARDGTPFATVEFPFSGAYSGADEAVFTWNGRIWSNALPEITPTNWTNVTMGAADEPWRAAYNVSYSNMFVNIDAAESEPHYQEFWTFLSDGKKQTRIGFGLSTAMRGDVVVGFSAGLSSIAKQQPPGPIAWVWVDGRRTELGPGVAYGVNTNGEVVGDDEAVLGGDGLPVLWRHGETIRLSNMKGAALAIGDDGTIVGHIENDGFVIRGRDASRRLIRIDTLLAEREWHISSVYGIAASGRLLAVGQRTGEPSQLLVLDPRN